MDETLQKYIDKIAIGDLRPQDDWTLTPTNSEAIGLVNCAAILDSVLNFKSGSARACKLSPESKSNCSFNLNPRKRAVFGGEDRFHTLSEKSCYER